MIFFYQKRCFHYIFTKKGPRANFRNLHTVNVLYVATFNTYILGSDTGSLSTSNGYIVKFINLPVVMGWSLCQTDSEHPTFNDLKSINKVMIHVSNYLLLLNFMVMYVPKICPHLRNISSKQVPKYLIIDIVRDALLSRNFCQKSVRVNFCDYGIP